MNETTQQAPARTWTEAPASINLRFLLSGFDVQLTLRGETGSELLKKLSGAVQALQEMDAQPTGWRPQPASPNGNGHAKAEGEEADPAYCPIHKCEMRRFEKDGRAWYSHRTDDGWCKGKPAKNGKG